MLTKINYISYLYSLIHFPNIMKEIVLRQNKYKKVDLIYVDLNNANSEEMITNKIHY